MKKNRMTKAFIVTMAGVLTVSATIGCVGCKKKGEVPNDPNSIEISYWKSGIGTEWLNKAAEKFEEAHPEYKVYVTPTASQQFLENTIKLTKDNTTDLYMTTVKDTQYMQYYEPIDDVLSYTHEGESKTIMQKMDSTVLETMKFEDGKHYTLSYGGGLCSIAYNKDMMSDEDVPNTTNELYDLVVDLKAASKTPFITFQGGGYWFMVYETWMIQYNGMDWYYNEWLDFKDESGAPDKAMLLDNEKTTGRYEVLEVLEKLLNPDYVVSGSSAAKYTVQQTKFLGGSAAMMPNGTWLYNEMKNSMDDKGNFKFAMMKTPVLSAITDNTPSIDSDRELSALIEAIDEAGLDKASIALTGAGYSVAQEDLDRVYEARNLISSVHDENACVIPNYSTAKEGAKEFLKFIYSDPMIRQFMDITHMNFPAAPSDGVVDLTGWNSWEKEVYQMHKECIQIPKFKPQHKVLAEAKVFADLPLYNLFAATNKDDRKTAAQVWTQMQNKYNENWEVYLYNAGYTN